MTIKVSLGNTIGEGSQGRGLVRERSGCEASVTTSVAGPGGARADISHRGDPIGWGELCPGTTTLVSGDGACPRKSVVRIESSQSHQLTTPLAAGR